MKQRQKFTSIPNEPQRCPPGMHRLRFVRLSFGGIVGRCCENCLYVDNVVTL